MAPDHTRVENSTLTAPDYVDTDTVPVFVTAMSNGVYFDVPDFDASERLIRKALSDDTSFANVDDDSIKNPENVTDRESAVRHLKARGKLRDDGLPSRANGDKDGIRTTQYLLKTETIEEHPVVLSDDKDLRHEFVDCFCETSTTSQPSQGEVGEFETASDKTALLERVGRYFAERGVVPSNRSGQLFPMGEWGTTAGGNYVCTISATESGTCPKCGENLSDTQTVVSSSNLARRATRYKCDPEKGGCGNKYRGITTG